MIVGVMVDMVSTTFKTGLACAAIPLHYQFASFLPFLALEVVFIEPVTFKLGVVGAIHKFRFNCTLYFRTSRLPSCAKFVIP
ncbi:MAG: hypothetical protein CFE34_06345 [Rhodobacteraceae bacterium PARR1]|nr:MAG: hypothetical protein CFE34_06345 [Rhodobacteraceae bacterium PARR1]